MQKLNVKKDFKFDHCENLDLDYCFFFQMVQVQQQIFVLREPTITYTQTNNLKIISPSITCTWHSYREKKKPPRKTNKTNQQVKFTMCT